MRLVLLVLSALVATVSLPPALAVAQRAPESFAPLARQLLPAVVNIQTTQAAPAARPGIRGWRGQDDGARADDAPAQAHG